MPEETQFRLVLVAVRAGMLALPRAPRWPGAACSLTVVATALALEGLLARPLAARPLERFDTDRPDLTEGAEPVGRGIWQLETGWGVESGGGPRAHVLGEGLLRVGLARWVEARLVLPSLQWESHTGAGKAGFGDGGAGIKVGTSGEARDWSAGAIVQVRVPSGALAHRAEAAEPEFVLAGESRLRGGWDVGANLGLTFPRRNAEAATDFFGTFTLGSDLSPRFALFAEYVGERSLETNGPWMQFADGGASWAIAEGWQFDGSIGRWVSGGNRMRSGLGVSRRW